MSQNRRFLSQCGPDAKQRALQLALEIYAMVPLIPRSLFISGLEILIDYARFGERYNGTLASGKHKTEATFWPRGWDLFVGHPFSLVPWNFDNLSEGRVPNGSYMGNFVT
jgi:hypothetical protein